MPDAQQKQCPLLMAGRTAKIGHPPPPGSKNEKKTRCIGSRCQFWVEVYTTESGGYAVSDCALTLGPRMNSDGRLVV